MKRRHNTLRLRYTSKICRLSCKNCCLVFQVLPSRAITVRPAAIQFRSKWNPGNKTERIHPSQLNRKIKEVDKTWKWEYLRGKEALMSAVKRVELMNTQPLRTLKQNYTLSASLYPRRSHRNLAVKTQKHFVRFILRNASETLIAFRILLVVQELEDFRQLAINSSWTWTRSYTPRFIFGSGAEVRLFNSLVLSLSRAHLLADRLGLSIRKS